MNREEIEPIIEKYQELSMKIESCSEQEYEKIMEQNPDLEEITDSDDDDYDDRNTFRLVDQFVDWMKDNIDGFEDVEDENELVSNYLEKRVSWTDTDFMFPNGNDDDD